MIRLAQNHLARTDAELSILEAELDDLRCRLPGYKLPLFLSPSLRAYRSKEEQVWDKGAEKYAWHRKIAELVNGPLCERGIIACEPEPGPGGLVFPLNDPVHLLMLCEMSESVPLETMVRIFQAGDQKSFWELARVSTNHFQKYFGSLRWLADEVKRYAQPLPLGTRLLRGMGISEGLRQEDGSIVPLSDFEDGMTFEIPRANSWSIYTPNWIGSASTAYSESSPNQTVWFDLEVNSVLHAVSCVALPQPGIPIMAEVFTVEPIRCTVRKITRSGESRERFTKRLQPDDNTSFVPERHRQLFEKASSDGWPGYHQASMSWDLIVQLEHCDDESE